MTLGEEYYIYDKENGHSINIKNIEEHQTVCIPENGVTFVITEESLDMPYCLSGEISLAFGLIKQGIMLSNQPPIDPGYKGKVVALLHNLSNKPIYLTRKQHIITIVFHEVSYTAPYEGDYQGLISLKQYVKRPIVGSLYEISNDLKSRREKFEKFIPFFLTTIVLIVGMLALLLNVFNASKFYSDLKINNFAVDYNNNAIAVDNNDNIVILEIPEQNKRFKIDFNSKKIYVEPRSQ